VLGDGFRYRCWCRSACYSKGRLAALLSDAALTVVACDPALILAAVGDDAVLSPLSSSVVMTRCAIRW